jgi:hypothetical protein
MFPISSSTSTKLLHPEIWQFICRDKFCNRIKQLKNINISKSRAIRLLLNYLQTIPERKAEQK